MKLHSDAQLANTRELLREFEERNEARRLESPRNAYVHELTLRSLKKTINQLKEQIAVYEAHRSEAPGVDPLRAGQQ